MIRFNFDFLCRDRPLLGSVFPSPDKFVLLLWRQEKHCFLSLNELKKAPTFGAIRIQNYNSKPSALWARVLLFVDGVVADVEGRCLLKHSSSTKTRLTLRRQCCSQRCELNDSQSPKTFEILRHIWTSPWARRRYLDSVQDAGEAEN